MNIIDIDNFPFKIPNNHYIRIPKGTIVHGFDYDGHPAKQDIYLINHPQRYIKRLLITDDLFFVAIKFIGNKKELKCLMPNQYQSWT